MVLLLSKSKTDEIISIIPLSTPMADNTQAELVSSIDGNVQLESGMPIAAMGSKIKINITKPILPAPQPCKEQELSLSETGLPDSSEPLPPGLEPVQLHLKPALQGVVLTENPTVVKGHELTGMCSIM